MLFSTSCTYCLLYFLFFFFKQKTAYEMRISDWSTDVCSSDLSGLDENEFRCALAAQELQSAAKCTIFVSFNIDFPKGIGGRREDFIGNYRPFDDKIGRASCRERVCQYV